MCKSKCLDTTLKSRQFETKIEESESPAGAGNQAHGSCTVDRIVVIVGDCLVVIAQ